MTIDHPVVLTLKFTPPQGGWVEARYEDVADAIFEKVGEINIGGLDFRLAELVIGGNEVRVLP